MPLKVKDIDSLLMTLIIVPFAALILVLCDSDGVNVKAVGACLLAMNLSVGIACVLAVISKDTREK